MRQHTIMIVDDEVNVINSLIRLLRTERYSMITATSGAEALEKLKQQTVSLVLADQRIPGFSGLDLLKEVKQLYPDALRMIISGYADLEVVIKAINEEEVYRFITKPWNDEELKIIIRQALAEYDLLMDNKILLRMVEGQRKLLSEIEAKFPDIAKLPKMKDGAYVIEETNESLEEFMQKYFPKEK